MFGTEAALIPQTLFAEMISWRDRYNTFVNYLATRIMPLTLCLLGLK